MYEGKPVKEKVDTVDNLASLVKEPKVDSNDAVPKNENKSSDDIADSFTENEVPNPKVGARANTEYWEG